MLFANHALATLRWSASGIVLIAIGVYAFTYSWLFSSDFSMPHQLSALLLVCLTVFVVWLSEKFGELSFIYLGPTRFITNVAYVAAIVGTGVFLLSVDALGRSDFLLITSLLFATTFPVFRGSMAAAWRGMVLSVLASVLFYTVLANASLIGPGVDLANGSIAVAWGFGLWAIASFVLNPWNRRFEHWVH